MSNVPGSDGKNILKEEISKTINSYILIVLNYFVLNTNYFLIEIPQWWSKSELKGG